MRTLYIYILLFFTVLNSAVFFYIKNNTHQMIIDNRRISSLLIEESKKLFSVKNEINKKYGNDLLKRVTTEKLNLQLSNVKQIRYIDDVFGK